MDHSQEKECEKELESLSTKKYYLQIKIFFNKFKFFTIKN